MVSCEHPVASYCQNALCMFANSMLVPTILSSEKDSYKQTFSGLLNSF